MDLADVPREAEEGARRDAPQEAEGEPPARGAAPRPPQGLQDPLLRARRRLHWLATMAAEGPVLVLGSETGELEPALAERGLRVVSVESRPEALARAQRAAEPLAPDVRSRITQLTQDALSVELEAAEFGTCLLADWLARHAQPDLLVRAALWSLRPGARLAVSVPFAGAEDGSQGFTLSGLVALLRPLCEVEELAIVQDAIRFVGRNRAPGPGWERYTAQWMLHETEAAAAALAQRLARALEAHRQERARLESNIRYRIGELLVETAKRPATALTLPWRLLGLYRRHRDGKGPQPKASVRADGELPPYPVPAVRPGRGPVIATILDPFSEYCWRYEAQLVPITQRSWRAQIDAARPDLLWVESAWEGSGGDWRMLVSRYPEQALAELSRLVAYCKARGIPTVFWNKDDPPNFERFIAMAELFEVVFTTDANCIPAYRERCGHDRVYALPFAAQPALHNPMRPLGAPQYEICFAGTWFAEKYPGRSEALRALLDPALERGLRIYDRHAAEGKEKFQFPERYRAAIQGALDYDRMLTAYRVYRVFLSVNSVPDSPTMFSRRVLEALACGTPVVSSPSVGMEAMLGDAVRVARSPEDTACALDALLDDEEARQRRAHLGYRLVHREHTCAQRLRTMFETIGRPLPDAEDWPRVTALLCTNRPHFLEGALENYRKQTYPNRELILVLNDNRFQRGAAEAMVADLPQARVMQLDESLTLGQCLNAAVEQASGAYLAKMDDDDLYGAEYLWDLMLAARFSGADITGKGVYHVYMTGPRLMGLRTVSREHALVARGLAGGTLLARRAVFDTVRFQSVPQGTDTRFLYDCEAEGFRFYSSDRFNYVMVRQSDPNLHTWPASERELLRFCQDVRGGLELSRAMV